jgi:hypothetical protein
LIELIELIAGGSGLTNHQIISDQINQSPTRSITSPTAGSTACDQLDQLDQAPTLPPALPSAISSILIPTSAFSVQVFEMFWLVVYRTCLFGKRLLQTQTAPLCI